MKNNSENKSLESLYRENLMEWESFPPKNFWNGFEKKLRLRQFMRFSQGNFNIYYLASLVAVGTVAVTMLLSSPDSTNNSPDITIDKLVTGKAVGVESELGRKEDVELLSRDSGKENLTSSATTDNTNKKVIVQREENLSGIEVNKLKDKPVDAFIDQYNEESNKEQTKLAATNPVSGFSASRVSGCAPLTINFTNQSMNYNSCIWEFGDGGVSSEGNPVWVFDEPGEYEVRLITFNSDNRSAVSKQKITIYETPTARFEINAGDAYLPNEQVIFYNYSVNSVSWQWNFGDGSRSTNFEPQHFYDEAGSYNVTLKAFSEFGCVDSMIITNAFSDASCYVKFPNAFTPNVGGPTGGYYSSRTDQISEVFHPAWSGVTQFQLRIFNKQGILLFESNDINVGWDGYFKGQRSEPGVYIWKARGTYKNGQPFVMGGDLTLLPRW